LDDAAPVPQVHKEELTMVPERVNPSHKED
jgi:hypothetical protein